MSKICIYHSRDLDGWMSAAIVKLAVPDIILIGYDYGQPIPEIPKDTEEVIMVDISFDRQLLETISKEHELTIIDHHASTIPKVKGLKISERLDTTYAACELCWQYFFSSSTPELVRLLGLYDSFRHKGTEEEIYVLEFQYGARSWISGVDGAINSLTIAMISEDSWQFLLGTIYSRGHAIYKYLCTEAVHSYAHRFDVHYNGYKFACINQERFNPVNYGIDYHSDGYDAFICFWYVNDKFLYSIYNDNGQFDCSEFATRLGGGGHKGAAGWQSSELINEHYFINKCQNSNNTKE